MNFIPTVSDLSIYGNYVNSIPILSEPEERELIKSYKETGDQLAAAKIINAFLRVPFSLVIKTFYWSDVPKQDLIQEGNYALMQSLLKFDPSFGIKFYSFALIRIKSAIMECINSFGSIIKFTTTKAKRKIASNYSQFGNDNFIGFSMNKSDKRIMSETLNVPESDISEYESFRKTTYIEISSSIESDSDRLTWADVIGYANEEKIDVMALIDYPLRNLLTERERNIIFSRWINSEKTFDQLSKELGVSIERVRQIEKSGLNKIKNYLKEQE